MTTLPPLPKKKERREADITPVVLDWFRQYHEGSCAIEIKATTEKLMPFTALERHQLAALQRASEGTLVHKISDAGRTRVPFDAFMLQRVPAYVVAAFVGKERVALVIPVEKWSGARPNSPSAFRIPL